MGGSLQPFFAERNLEAQAAMSSNTYRAPADQLGEGGRTDTALALSIAAMEQQQERRRQQEAQRQGYNSQQPESRADVTRRQSYHNAQRLPPLQYGRTSQYGMSGGTPASVGSLSVPYQSSTYKRHVATSEPDLTDHTDMRVDDSDSLQQPKRTSEHRRSISSELPQGSRLPDVNRASNTNHHRSISHDANKPPRYTSRSEGPATFLEMHHQMLEVQKRRPATNDALPVIRTNVHVTTDAVAHVTDSLPLPTSPFAGTVWYWIFSSPERDSATSDDTVVTVLVELQGWPHQQSSVRIVTIDCLEQKFMVLLSHRGCRGW